MPNLIKQNNINALHDNAFKLNILELPYVTMFAQSLTIPGISLGEALFYTPNVDIKVPGEKITFDNLDVDFLVDEQLLNYREIWNWMIHLGFPQSTEQFKIMKNGGTQFKETSDIGCISTTNKLNPNIMINFIDAFPVTLSPITMTSTNSDTEYMMATVSFAYSYFYFNKHDDTY